MMDEIKPVAWRSKDYSPLLEGQFAWAFTANDNDLRPDHEPLYDQQAIDTLWAEVEALRAKTACTMGVGAGDGQLFVHGDYDSIKAAQALVFRAERAEAEADALRKGLRGALILLSVDADKIEQTIAEMLPATKEQR